MRVGIDFKKLKERGKSTFVFLKEMISEIQHLIHHSVEGFLEQTAKEFDIPMAKLKENWEAHLGLQNNPSLLSSTASTAPTMAVAVAPPPKKKTAKKTFHYQNFFVSKRVELIKANPDLQFGEISSRISKMWNDMTKEEQQKYATPVAATTAAAAPAVTSTATPLPSCVAPVVAKVEFNFEGLNAKNMPELRKLCEEKGLKRTGNKLQLIHNLLGIHKVAPPVVEEKKPILMVHPMEETEDVEVVVAKNMKRSDIEEEIIPSVFSDEEQDFEFEEDGSNYSVNLEEDD